MYFWRNKFRNTDLGIFFMKIVIKVLVVNEISKCKNVECKSINFVLEEVFSVFWFLRLDFKCVDRFGIFFKICF